MTHLVFATNNLYKLREVRQLLGDQIKVLSLDDIGCNEDIPENQPTIEGNAAEKAFYIYNNYHYNSFADDTGLEIEALNGEPGVYSARYAGECKDMNANILKVLEKLKNSKNRKARFKTVISLVLENKEYQFPGIIDGEIISEKRGNSGFGYDPIFLPAGYSKTFAEMSASEKNDISHRGIAVRRLVEFLVNQFHK